MTTLKEVDKVKIGQAVSRMILIPQRMYRYEENEGGVPLHNYAELTLT